MAGFPVCACIIFRGVAAPPVEVPVGVTARSTFIAAGSVAPARGDIIAATAAMIKIFFFCVITTPLFLQIITNQLIHSCSDSERSPISLFRQVLATLKPSVF
jgi:hypothetical protein